MDENIVRELIKSGTGVALTPKDEAKDLVKNGHAVIWKGVSLELPLAIACLEKRKNEKAIVAFLEEMQKKFKVYKK